jgi:hypothetical protein
MNAKDAAEAVADLVVHLGKRPDLILEDAFGNYRHLFFFQLPCTDTVSSLLAAKGFTLHHRARTPHDSEADVFLNGQSSALVEFSDPSKNSHIVLWPGPPPEKTEAADCLEKALQDRDFN